MLLEVYDKETLSRVDIIRTYTFVQYTDYFNDVGTFKIKVPINELSLKYLMIQGNYILFEKLGDKFIMGIIKYFHKEGIETPTVEIKGYMLPHILTYRCFQTTYQLYDRVFEIQRDFIQRFFINTDDIRRQIDLMMISDSYDKNTKKIRYCKTGSDCAESIREMNEPYHYGFGLVPAIAKYDPETGRDQNIMRFTFEQYVPTDRRVGNVVGNDPVVFDTELNNVEDVIYEIDGTKAKTVAIVAGEGEGIDRTILEVGDKQLSGIDRNELYVDARDLQKQQGNEFDFSSAKLVGNGVRQSVWNSASSSEMQNVQQIIQIVISANVSVENETESSQEVRIILTPYIGAVEQDEIVLASQNVDSGLITNFDFYNIISSNDVDEDYFTSFAIFGIVGEKVAYRVSGTMKIESTPEVGGATTDEEYDEMLEERGQQKLKENAFSYDFEATAFTQTNNSFQYGRDYKNGDYVTVIDRTLGIAVGVQIVAVTRSLTETGEVLDLVFGNQILGDTESGGGDSGGGGSSDDEYVILPYQDTYNYMSSNSQEDFGYSTLTYNQTMAILKSED